MNDSPGPGDPGGTTSQTLYRRFRPQRFEQLRGQPHVAQALRNSVRDGRVAHAYLFSGPRGTGKTSAARILAMALNCESPCDGEPDGTCPTCVAIRTGISLMVREIDAASNRKLEEMKALLDHVILGAPGFKRVYILDEVHQLTNDASSALLKTLEEPPEHVVFVLATTELQKVLPTIKSRTQHYQFRLLGNKDMTALLSEVNDQAGLGLSPAVIAQAVAQSGGSARDALSALDRLSVMGFEQPGGSAVGELVRAMIAQDTGALLVACAQAVSAGYDPRQLANELLVYLRDMFMTVQAPAMVGLPDAETAEAARLASQMGLVLLVRSMEMLGRCLVEMRDSVDPRVTLEVTLISAVRSMAGNDINGLLSRLERLERLVGQDGTSQGTPGSARVAAAARPQPAQAAVVPAPAAQPAPAPAATSAPAAAQHQEPAPAPAAQPIPVQTVPTAVAAPPANLLETALPSRDELTKAWGDTILDKLLSTTRALMANGRFVSSDTNGVVFALPTPGLLISAGRHQQEVQAALSAHFGMPLQLHLVSDKPVEVPSVPPHAPVPAAAAPAPPSSAPPAGRAPAAPTPAPAVPPDAGVLDIFPGATIVG